MDEINRVIGIFQAFDMEKFFDKEGLIETLYKMYKKGMISKKDYRMCFMLNNKTCISILALKRIKQQFLMELDRVTLEQY